MGLFNLSLEEYKKKYGDFFEPLNNDNEFLLELVHLGNIGIRNGNKTNEFHNKVTRLLEYLQRTANADLALVLTETLHEIRLYTKFYVTDNATNVGQLCTLFSIQFVHSTDKIYFEVLKLLNYCEGTLGKANIDSVLCSNIKKVDANIYEWFNLDLSLELLHTYLIVDRDALKTLFIDMNVDWGNFDDQINENTFEKLLWYGFLLNNEELLKEQVNQYPELMKSDNWGVKFYRYINKKLLKKDKINQEKIEALIKHFKKLEGYSVFEKEKISETIISKLKGNSLEISKGDVGKNKQYKGIKEIYRLSPYNLPPGIKLEDVNQKTKFELMVYKDEKMNQVIKTVPAEGLLHSEREEIYITKPVMKILNHLAKPGYIKIIDDTKKRRIEMKKKEDQLFKWPSTDVSGSGENSHNETNGFAEMSALRKRGYQITNTTREQRWRILQLAVPEIGLKKVAYTIAGNVKLRKGQKNGTKKFRYAISEWEHDLARLKVKYYKKDFIWPNT
ncbi:hypothetical protein [Bacillus sp. KH172YL63]|uniref:hypothetical protein n=1 Tax=Bacillus sp. KH172YL63 TaxID=2709784 RepID=UPI0013E4E32B|nr:hypothetical protein [Bacillus sp. KH172YL63]BCB02141.1 hypothetical protein KH172YL63_02740 [Bacillus sp. KH172YL63]